MLRQLGWATDPFFETKAAHIVTSAAFLALPGLAAWGVDLGWRRWLDPAAVLPQLPSLPQLLPAWAGGVGGGGAGASAEPRRSKEEVAAEAHALAVLRASGEYAEPAEVAGAGAGAGAGAAAASVLASTDGGADPAARLPLKPFVEIAYGARQLLPRVASASCRPSVPSGRGVSVRRQLLLAYWSPLAAPAASAGPSCRLADRLTLPRPLPHRTHHSQATCPWCGPASWPTTWTMLSRRRGCCCR